MTYVDMAENDANKTEKWLAIALFALVILMPLLVLASRSIDWPTYVPRQQTDIQQAAVEEITTEQALYENREEHFPSFGPLFAKQQMSTPQAFEENTFFQTKSLGNPQDLCRTFPGKSSPESWRESSPQSAQTATASPQIWECYGEFGLNDLQLFWMIRGKTAWSSHAMRLKLSTNETQPAQETDILSALSDFLIRFKPQLPTDLFQTLPVAPGSILEKRHGPFLFRLMREYGDVARYNLFITLAESRARQHRATFTAH